MAGQVDEDEIANHGNEHDVVSFGESHVFPLVFLAQAYTDKQHEEAKRIAIEALEQRMWIPVHKRVPKKNGNYLVTYETSDGTATLRYEAVDHYGPSWLHESKHTKAVAWMPLPEPYKEERQC